VLTVIGAWDRAPVPDHLLGRRERAIARTFPPWRRDEWVRGRLTAHAALLLSGVPAPDGVQILRATDGAPAPAPEPDGWRISLSHTAGLVACAVDRGGGPVGVDVEHPHPGNERLRTRITGPADRVPGDLDATVLFSCKEAALKAYRAPLPGLAGYPVRAGTGGRLRVGVVGADPASYRTAWPTRVCGAVAVTVTAGAPPDVVIVDRDAILRVLRGSRRGRATR
jgi:4'-phosphopantetheinyl transferase